MKRSYKIIIYISTLKKTEKSVYLKRSYKIIIYISKLEKTEKSVYLKMLVQKCSLKI